MTRIQVPTSGLRPVWGANIRISEDPEVFDPKTGELRRLEKGITRQREDITQHAERLGVDIGVWYEENDVSAFKKKRIRLPNGRSVWRVIRPDFREMLEDYEDGKIQGIIYYDLDRLTRQPRDLEDLIDLVEFYKRPVETVTGNLDIRTSNGRVFARMMVVMANKASEDTSRRVARARLQQAQEGQGRTFRSRRPFGYNPDGSANQAEAELIRDAAKRFTAGESWSGLVRLFTASGITPVVARAWTGVTVKQILLSPAIAGIAIYNGVLRREETADAEGQEQPESQASGTPYAWVNPEAQALKKADGSYLMGTWDAILTGEKWQEVVAEHKRRKEAGRYRFGGSGTRKHLLSGLLRCGRIRDDGQMCFRSLAGYMRKHKSGNATPHYKCPPKVSGGCAGTDRSAAQLDKLIEDLLFAHLEENAPAQTIEPEPDPATDPDAARLAEIRRKIAMIREGYGTDESVSDDTFFITLPKLEAKEKQLLANVRKAQRERSKTVARMRSVADIRAEWDAADLSGKRAILAQYLEAVVVSPSASPNRWHFDHEAIRPVWKDTA